MTSGDTVEPRLGLLGDSFIYASAALRSRVCRHSATLACALTPQPLSISADGQQWRGHLMAIRPFSWRAIDSGGQPVVRIDLEPTHLRYNTFSHWPDRAPVRVLDAHGFAGLRDCARAFAHRTLSGRRLQASVQLLVGSVADSVAPHRPLEVRVRQMMAALRLDPAGFYKLLTEHEQRLLSLFGEGLSNEAVAARVHLSASTVKAHRRTILGKLGIHSTPELIH